MKKIALALPFLLFFSCSKDPVQPPSSDCRLTSIDYDFSTPRAYSVTYSGSNIAALSSPVDRTEYTYNNANRLIRREQYQTGDPQVQFRIEYEYNTQGELATQTNYEFYSGSLQATSRYVFTHTNGKLTQMEHYSLPSNTLNGRERVTWTNDNPTTLAFYDADDNLECAVNMTYDAGRVNHFNLANPQFYLQDLYDEDLSGIHFMSRNVLTSRSESCPTLEEDLMTYTYNEKGFISDIFINGSTQPVWRFHYSCD